MMKKVLFLLVAALFSMTAASAQIHYQGEVSLGAALGVGDNGLNKLDFETIHGVRINPYFFCGAGIGIQDYVDTAEDTGALTIPVFAHFKGYLLDNDITPFLSADLGYGIGAGNALSGLGGFYASPTVGCEVKLDNGMGLNFGIGYQAQMFSEEGYDSVTSSAFVFKIGFSF